MTPWQGILTEAREDRTLFVVAALIVTAAILHRFAEPDRRRRAPALFLVALHVLAVPIAGALRPAGGMTYEDVRLPCLMSAVLACVWMGASLLFDVVLPRLRLPAPRILQDVLLAGAGLIAVFAVASRAGLNLSGLIATSAVITAVIGFSLQDTLGNVMGGLALQLDASIKVGDWVKYGDVSGRVVEINWRHTAIETRNWETLVVPNGILMKNPVLVLGRRRGQPVQLRRWVYFNVDFRHSPADVISCVTEAIRARPIERVATEPPPNVVLMDFTESWGRYACRYWLTEIAIDDPTDSVVRNRIYFALKRAGMPPSIPAHAVFLTEESTERKRTKRGADHDRRRQALARVDLFATLAGDELDHLADGLVDAPFTAGEVMTRQGAEGHWLYIITKGEAAIRVADAEGHESEVARVGAGHFFGEMSLMTGEPRAATVVALTDVEAYRLDRASFHEVVRRHPECAEDVAAVLARRKMELTKAKDTLDQAAHRAQLAATTGDFLVKIRDFFGLD